jgi:hypothetical protein
MMGELDVASGEVSLQSVPLRGGGDHNGVLGVNPGEENLLGSEVVRLGDLLERLVEGSSGLLSERTVRR